MGDQSDSRRGGERRVDAGPRPPAATVSVAGMADLDYAYTDMKDLGGAHRFSLTFTF